MTERPPLLYGLELRYVLTDLVWSERRIWTTAELAARLQQAGFALTDRPSKVVADALRWEIGRGRVVRTGRGRYVAGSAPASTNRRIRRRAAERRAEARSWRRGRVPGSLDA